MKTHFLMANKTSATSKVVHNNIMLVFKHFMIIFLDIHIFAVAYWPQLFIFHVSLIESIQQDFVTVGSYLDVMLTRTLAYSVTVSHSASHLRRHPNLYETTARGLSISHWVFRSLRARVTYGVDSPGHLLLPWPNRTRAR